MMVKDGNGTIIEFVWPSLWYLVKAGFAVAIGAAAALLVLWLPVVLLWFSVLGGLLAGARR
jgi:hypothetical protein